MQRETIPSGAAQLPASIAIKQRMRRLATNDESAGAKLAGLRRWAHRLDAAFRIPGTGIRFGWDPIISMFPFVGDAISALLSLGILMAGFRMGLPKIVQLRMALNVALDLLIGSVPVLGDLLDFAWKANTRNMELLDRHATGTVKPALGDWIFVLAMLGIVTAAAAFAMLLMWTLLNQADRLPRPAWRQI
jgi:hypothetical protein